MAHHDFAIAPRLWRLFAFWVIFQVMIVVVAFGRSRGVLEKFLPFVVIASPILFVACALGGVMYYRSLRNLRERGVVIEGEVVPGKRQSIYWVKYAYDEVEYNLRVGMVVDFDIAVQKTLARAVSEKRPVRLLIDSAKPKRYFILPFEASEQPDGDN
jgi:hypothetical protein